MTSHARRDGIDATRAITTETRDSTS